MRLDRVLANAGLGSRSEIRKLIRSGQVKLDQQVITDAGYQVHDPAAAKLMIRGQPVETRQHLYIMFNKPAGLITAMEDKKDNTIADRLPRMFLDKKVAPVGRLDRDTTGLLILTNDGTLSHRLASPRWSVGKVYDVTIHDNGVLFSEKDINLFAAGIQLSDDFTCKPARLEVLGKNRALLEIHEGKFHQVKRMMQKTGREVAALHRVRIGPLFLDPDLNAGDYRHLSQQEVDSLYHAVRLTDSEQIQNTDQF